MDVTLQPSCISVRSVWLSDRVKLSIDFPGSIAPAVLSRAEVESLVSVLGACLIDWDGEEELRREHEAKRELEAAFSADDTRYQPAPF